MRKPDLYDLVTLLGLALMTAGLWLWWPPLGLVALGLGLILAGLAGASGKGHEGG